jgi:hypothetical protein
LVDVDPLGERATVGMAKLGGDDAGRFLVGRHRRGQRMAQHVGMGIQPDACGQPGEGPAGVVGVDRRTPLGTEHQVELDLVGRPGRLDPTQRHGGGLPHGQQPGLLAAVTAQRLDGEGWQGEHGVAGSGLDRPDGQLLAPANDSASAAFAVAGRGGVGEDRGSMMVSA